MYQQALRHALKTPARNLYGYIQVLDSGTGRWISIGRPLWLELLGTDAEFVAAVSHQYAQIPDAQVADFMHANQYRCTDRQSAVTDLADDGWGDFQRLGKRGVIFEMKLLEQRVH